MFENVLWHIHFHLRLLDFHIVDTFAWANAPQN